MRRLRDCREDTGGHQTGRATTQRLPVFHAENIAGQKCTPAGSDRKPF